MKKIYDAVKSNALFNGIGGDEFTRMCRCMDARTKTYAKGDVILMSGQAVGFVGLVLGGGVRIIKEDSEGNTMILAEFGTGELFGEAFACAGIDYSPVTVQASGDSEILFIDYKRIKAVCPSACEFHARLIENMLSLIAKKNLLLNQKIEILSKRTTREKLLLFLEFHGGAQKKFTVPYNREEMANYLCVDRSAMSNELCKMRDEGLIRFSRNLFEIL